MMPHFWATQRDWNAVAAEPTPQDLAGLTSDGRRTRHVHVPRPNLDRILAFRARWSSASPYCYQAGEQTGVSMVEARGGSTDP
jgi:hypothetical protein